MLQFTITRSEQMSAIEQARMAVAAGCEWIELDLDEYTPERSEEVAKDVISICKAAGVILVFKHNDILVDKLRVHGVTLSTGDSDAGELRKKLGGHVIIGVEYTDDTNWIALKRADVDYILVDNATPSLIENLFTQSEAIGGIPIVARGRFGTDEIKNLYAAGAAGFNIDIQSLLGPNYKDSLTRLVNYCNNIRG